MSVGCSVCILVGAAGILFRNLNLVSKHLFSVFFARSTHRGGKVRLGKDEFSLSKLPLLVVATSKLTPRRRWLNFFESHA